MLLQAIDATNASAEPIRIVRRSLSRKSYADGVECRAVNERGLVGTFCAPPGTGKRGAILAFGGSEGGTYAGTGQAFIYASWGHPTLGVAYFNESGLPSTLANIPLEYFARAMDWLDEQPTVRPRGTVVAGGSRGGELALLLGATFDRIGGVFAVVPSGYAWSSAGAADEAAWTFAGAPVPFVPSSGTASVGTVQRPDGGIAYVSSPQFRSDIAEAPAVALDSATIRVEKIAGPVLMLAGADDQLWPSREMAKVSMDRLHAAAHDKTYADTFVCYPDAGHSLAFVGGSTMSPMWTKLGGAWYALGGTAKGIAAAQRDGYNRRRAFLEMATGPTKERP